MQAEGRVGPIVAADGSVETVRLGKFLDTIVSDAHGRYYEATSRGNVYVAANSAAQATTTGASLCTGLILTNPVGTAKMLAILDITVGVGAAVAAAFEVGLFANTNPLAAPVVQTAAIVPKNGLLGSANVGVGLAASSVTLPATPTHIRTLLASGWVTATAQSQELAKDEVAAAICLLPGTAASVQSVVGTQSIIASMTWEEITL